MLEKAGFCRRQTDFTQQTKHDVLELFHSYGFKDAEGNELVACNDFLNLVAQITSIEKVKKLSVGEIIIAESAVEDFYNQRFRHGR